MACMKRNARVKAGVAAMAFVLCGTSVIGSVCNVPGAATVQAAGETTRNQAEATSQQVVNLDTNWKYLDNNTDPAEGLGSLTAWTTADFNDDAWKEEAGKFGAKLPV